MFSGVYRNFNGLTCETHTHTRFVQIHASHVSEYLYYVCLRDKERRGDEWLPVEHAEESPPTLWTCERGNAHGESHGSGTETIRPCKYEYEVKNRREQELRWNGESSQVQAKKGE